jgi:hypothetical protein
VDGVDVGSTMVICIVASELSKRIVGHVVGNTVSSEYSLKLRSVNYQQIKLISFTWIKWLPCYKVIRVY